jgi:hypothetical protein
MYRSRRQRLGAYRRDGSVCLIEITLRELKQLFNTLDPAPFHEKDLDPAAEEYIVSAVREIGSQPSRLVLQLPQGTTDDEACGAVGAIRNYFADRTRHAREQLRLLFVRGVISLLIGLAFLAICLSVRELLLATARPGDAIASEGLLILGWVAMWKPVEIFLYDWWPDLDKLRLFERIAHMQIETQAGPAAAFAPDPVPAPRLANA